MRINSDYDVVINPVLFNKYIFNTGHYFGSLKCASFQKFGLNNESIDKLIELLYKVPLNQDMECIDLVAKAGLIYKFSNISRFCFDGRTIYLKSLWLHKSNSAAISLLNITRS
jgi:hypothetical protein